MLKRNCEHCGAEFFVEPRHVSGSNKGRFCSRPCSARGVTRRPFKNFIGLRFGRLTVISHAELRNQKHYWNCRCDCGSEKQVSSNALPLTTSCGCACRDRGIKLWKTHGRSSSGAYSSWRAMLGRCYNPKDISFHRYGGAGISVCDRWRDSLENFVSDMGERPDGYSIERKDNSLGYSPDNCCWATRKEQARNTRANVTITHEGITATIVEWSERLGLPRSTLSQRIAKGWPISRAFTEPRRITRRSLPTV